MTSRLLPLALLAALAAPVSAQDPAPEGPDPAPGAEEGEAGAPEAEPRKPKKRDLAPDTPEAKALAQLLALDPRYASDGTVHLVYTFKEEEHTADWDHAGFDMTEEVGNPRARNKRKRLEKPRFLALGAGSRQAGVLLHRLPLSDAFEVTFTLHAERATSRSDLVFVVGDGGVRWGGQVVQRRGSGFKPLAGEPLLDAFAGGKRAKVRMVVDGRRLTVWIDGQQVLETDRLANKLDGRVGLVVSDMLLIVHEVEIKGRIDKAKL